MSTEPRPPLGAGRWLALLVAAALVMSLSFVLDGARSAGPRPSLAADVLPPVEEPTCDRWALTVGNGRVSGADVSLFTNGLAVLRACDPNPRELRLRGTIAAGSGAFAVLLDEAGIAFAGLLAGETEVEVRGDLRLYFTNDLATASEDRNLHAAIR